MATLTADQERLALSRLFHRFGFGPRPGEFAKALTQGFAATANSFLYRPSESEIARDLLPITIEDTGVRPQPGTFENTEFVLKLRTQIKDMTLWSLDQMANTQYPLNEKMTWFWHGHWATSVEKLNFALPMFKQNATFRKYALGNFSEQSRAMYNDGALQFWLDGQENTAAAPNENLSREFMELFTLGVGRYTEDDVKALARIFTGMQVVRTNGNLTFNPRRHDYSAVTLLGKTQVFTAEQAVDLLTARDDSSRFIYERIWFRHISSTEALPSNFDRTPFAGREIFSLVKALVNSPSFYNAQYLLVKSPVEWCIGICRALSIKPSAVKNPQALTAALTKLGQLPFTPPNVGGWPDGELWLTSASAQFRLGLSDNIIKSANLSFIQSVAPINRIEFLKNHLGIYQWSSRTLDALRVAQTDPARLLLLALNSPEYVVGA